jgi:hypothetical protein
MKKILFAVLLAFAFCVLVINSVDSLHKIASPNKKPMLAYVDSGCPQPPQRPTGGPPPRPQDDESHSGS